MALNQLGDQTVVNSNYLFLSRKLPSFPNKSSVVRTTTKPNVCKKCGGTAKIRCKECVGQGIVTCLACRGTGESNKNVCIWCAGDGYKDCTHCRGRGSNVCRNCRGPVCDLGRFLCRGKVEKRKFERFGGKTKWVRTEFKRNSLKTSRLHSPISTARSPLPTARSPLATSRSSSTLGRSSGSNRSRKNFQKRRKNALEKQRPTRSIDMTLCARGRSLLYL